MTKFKHYKYGPHAFKTYFKPAGDGWEVGMTYHGRNYFMGNFVFKNEATQWWNFFNKEIKSFCHKYHYTKMASFSWYCTFVANHLYKCYYSWLDKQFYKHQHMFKKAYSRDYKKFMKFKRKATTKGKKFEKFYLKAV